MRSSNELIPNIRNNKVHDIRIGDQLVGAAENIPEMRADLRSHYTFAMPNQPNQVLLVQMVPMVYPDFMSQANLIVWDLVEKRRIKEKQRLFNLYSPYEVVLLPKSNQLAVVHGTFGSVTLIDLTTFNVKSVGNQASTPGFTQVFDGDKLFILAPWGNTTSIAALKDGEHPIKPFHGAKWPLTSSLYYSERSGCFMRTDGSLHLSRNSLDAKGQLQEQHKYSTRFYGRILPHSEPENDGLSSFLYLKGSENGSLRMVSYGNNSSDPQPIPFQFDGWDEIRSVHVMKKDGPYPRFILIETTSRDTPRGTCIYLVKLGYDHHVKLGKIDGYASGNPLVRLPGNRFATEYLWDLALLNFYQMETGNELNAILKAIMENTSVTEMTIRDVALDQEGISLLHALQQKKKDQIKFNLSPSILLSLKCKSVIESIINEEESLKKDAIILFLRQQLAVKKDECIKLCSLVQSNNKEIKELEIAVNNQDKSNAELLASVQVAKQEKEVLFQQVPLLKNEIAKLESMLAQEEKSYQENTDELAQQLSEKRNEYLKTLKLLSDSEIVSEPITKRLDEAKLSLDDQLLSDMLKEDEKIENFYLIRWSEQEDVVLLKNNLMDKGAILTVENLCARIQAVKPPHNEQAKINLLSTAIDKLMTDYSLGLLPESAILSLQGLIIPDIEQAINTAKPDWLNNFYLMTMDLQNTDRTDRYFSQSSPLLSEEIEAIDSQFKAAILLLKCDPSYEHYQKYFVDPLLLEKIRHVVVSEVHEFNSDELNADELCIDKSKSDELKELSDSIKATMITLPLEVTPFNHKRALDAMFKNPSKELQQFMDDKIFYYFKKLKEKLNPLQAEIERLQLVMTEQQKKHPFSASSATLFSNSSIQKVEILPQSKRLNQS